eukprot:1554432-Prymnesium_polylepis.1
MTTIADTETAATASGTASRKMNAPHAAGHTRHGHRLRHASNAPRSAVFRIAGARTESRRSAGAWSACCPVPSHTGTCRAAAPTRPTCGERPTGNPSTGRRSDVARRPCARRVAANPQRRGGCAAARAWRAARAGR